MLDRVLQVRRFSARIIANKLLVENRTHTLVSVDLRRRRMFHSNLVSEVTAVEKGILRVTESWI